MADLTIQFYKSSYGMIKDALPSCTVWPQCHQPEDLHTFQWLLMPCQSRKGDNGEKAGTVGRTTNFTAEGGGSQQQLICSFSQPDVFSALLRHMPTNNLAQVQGNPLVNRQPQRNKKNIYLLTFHELSGCHFAPHTTEKCSKPASCRIVGDWGINVTVNYLGFFW